MHTANKHLKENILKMLLFVFEKIKKLPPLQLNFSCVNDFKAQTLILHTKSVYQAWK